MNRTYLSKAGRVVLAIALLSFAVMGLSGCSSKTEVGAPETKDGKTIIKVGASPVPHAEILNEVKEDLAKEDIDLQITEYSDYVVPNTALNDGDINANFFQHKPYLDDFNKKNGTDLVSIGKVHFEPLGIYPGKTTSLDAIKDKAKIAIPNDTTNEARALLLLQDEGLITLKDGAGIEATPNDVAENPKNIEFVEAEAASIPRLVSDVDFAVINGNYVLSAGLDPKTVLAAEKADSLAADTYANIIVVRSNNKDNEALKKLVKAVQSEKVRSFIDEKYQGLVVPVF